MDIVEVLYETLCMRDCFSDANTDEEYNKVMHLILKNDGTEQGNEHDNEVQGAVLELLDRNSHLAFLIGLQAGLQLKSIEKCELPKIEV